MARTERRQQQQDVAATHVIPKLNFIAMMMPFTAMLARTNPDTRLMTSTPGCPTRRRICLERTRTQKTKARLIAKREVVSACSATDLVLLSVSNTTVNIDPAPAMLGIASG